MKKQTYKQYPRVNHDIENNKLIITLKEGAGEKKKYLEGRIIIDENNKEVFNIEIAPFEL